MRSIRFDRLLLAFAMSLCVGCAPVPARQDSAPPTAEPIPLGEAGSEPLAFRRVVYRIPASSVIGSARIGGRQQEEIRWTVARTQTVSFNVAVTDGLRKLGYDVRDEADAIFDPNGQAKVRYEMAAILHDAAVDFDYRMNRARDGPGEGTGRARVEVEVRLYDSLRKETVYRRRLTGVGHDEGRKPNPLMSAIVSAILKSTADPAFVSLVAIDPPEGLARVESNADLPPSLVLAGCTDRTSVALPDDLPDALASVVDIRAGKVGGTGVIISPDGWILTAAHVVRDAPEIWARLDSGTQLPARIVQLDPETDLALLRIPGRQHPCARVRTASGPLDLGSDVFAVNVALDEGGRPTVTRGVVSGFPIKDGLRFIQTDASINPGSSGGPLLARDGSVAGITVLKIVGHGVEGLGLAVPVAEAIRQLDIELRQ